MWEQHLITIDGGSNGFIKHATGQRNNAREALHKQQSALGIYTTGGNVEIRI